MQTLTRSLTIATLAAGLALTSIAAVAAPGQEGPQRPGREAMRQEMLAKYDTNKDGKLDDAERAAIKAERFKKLDKAGKGQITRADFPAALIAAENEARNERALAMFDRMDANKDGIVTAEEFNAFKPDHGRDHPRKERGEKKPQ